MGRHNPEKSLSRIDGKKAVAALAASAFFLTGCSGEKTGSKEIPAPSVTTSETTVSPTQAAAPETTPSPSETSESSETTSTPDALGEQLMSDEVSAAEFAKFPVETRVRGALTVAQELEDSWIDLDLFAGSFTDGMSLDEYNPVRNPLSVGSSFKEVRRQHTFSNALYISRRAEPDSQAFNQEAAKKVAYGLHVYDPSNAEGVSITESIENTDKIGKFSDEELRKIEYKSFEAPDAITTEDGLSTYSMTGVIELGGQEYRETYIFVPVDELGEGNGVWLLDKAEAVK